MPDFPPPPGRRVAIIGGARTPFVKAGTTLRRHTALQLGAHAVQGLLVKHQIEPNLVEEMNYGIVVLDPRVPHMAREICFSSDLPDSVKCLTMTNNCITGGSAIAGIFDSIVAGRAEVGIAGGVESMSNPPMMFSRGASRIFLDAAGARSTGARVKDLLKLRPGHFSPHPPGVKEPSTGLTMGEHTELMVKEWGIPQEQQDEIALRSHQRAHAATEDGRLTAEVHPLRGGGGRLVEKDLLIRASTSMEKLAKLKPVFDRSSTGTLTAGNSSPLTDGAAAVLLMSEKRAVKENREPLAFIRDFEFVGIDPDDGLLMGPGLTVPRLLRRNGLELADMDIIEMHEAFGGQVACNLAAWERGWKEPAIGTVDPEKLNPLGSSIAVGHPFAATAIRIATTLANEMVRRNARYGLISVCGAGATAVAMLLARD